MILTDYRLFVFGQDIHSGLDLFDELSITKIIPVILPAIFGLFWIIWTSGNSLSWGEAVASMETSLMRFAMLVSALSRLSLIPLVAVLMGTFTLSIFTLISLISRSDSVVPGGMEEGREQEREGGRKEMVGLVT